MVVLFFLGGGGAQTKMSWRSLLASKYSILPNLHHKVARKVECHMVFRTETV